MMNIYKIRESLAYLEHANEVMQATVRYTVFADDAEINKILGNVNIHLQVLKEEIDLKKYFKLEDTKR